MLRLNPLCEFWVFEDITFNKYFREKPKKKRKATES